MSSTPRRNKSCASRGSITPVRIKPSSGGGIPTVSTEFVETQKQLLTTLRHYEERVNDGPNAHAYWYRARKHLDGPVVGPLRIVLNYLVIHLCKHLPSLALKRWLLRWLGMRLGHNVTIVSGVTRDYFFPELIDIGPDTIVGVNAMLLTHEFLHDRLRTGRVSIGRGCLIGANCTVLAGVTLGAALVMIVADRMAMQHADQSRVIQGLVTGIGFIGGGAILKITDERRIKGLTTAAGIWMTAAIGIAVGAGKRTTAVVATFLTFVVLRLLHLLEERFFPEPSEEA